MGRWKIHRIDGKSIVNIIRSDNARSPHDIFVWQSGGSNGSPQWAVRAGDWKLLHKPLGNTFFKNEENDQQLYLLNVVKDVEESENKAREHPQIVKRLYKKYEEWVKDVNATND
jgi:arylsulfatase A